MGKFKGLTLLNFSEFTHNLILQIKARNDLELAYKLLTPFKAFIKDKFKDYHLIPAPSTKASNKKRGFNHVVELFKLFDLPILEAFIKTKDFKQSNKRLNQRIDIKEVIKLKEGIILPNKILVVDDIITSGNTLKTCLELLERHRPKKLKFLVVANNCRKIKQIKDEFKTKLQ